MSYCLRMNRRSASGSVTEASAMAGFLILYVPEDPAEKKADKRPAEHDLPEESHREILRHSRKPGWYEIHETRLVEYECGPETHDGTHQGVFDKDFFLCMSFLSKEKKSSPDKEYPAR